MSRHPSFSQYQGRQRNGNKDEREEREGKKTTPMTHLTPVPKKDAVTWTRKRRKARKRKYSMTHLSSIPKDAERRIMKTRKARKRKLLNHPSFTNTKGNSNKDKEEEES